MPRTPAEIHGSCYSKCESPRGAKHSENAASYSMATLYQHLMALPYSCSTYIHQNPIHVRDKLPAARIPANKPPAHHLLHRPNAPIRLGASTHSLLHLGKYFQWNMQTNQPWDHQQQLLLSACRVLSKSRDELLLPSESQRCGRQHWLIKRHRIRLEENCHSAA